VKRSPIDPVLTTRLASSLAARFWRTHRQVCSDCHIAQTRGNPAGACETGWPLWVRATSAANAASAATSNERAWDTVQDTLF
jgi:CxxC motif-containing protein (DUF1111 family)